MEKLNVVQFVNAVSQVLLKTKKKKIDVNQGRTYSRKLKRDLIEVLNVLRFGFSIE